MHWYYRYRINYRDVEKMLLEYDARADHTTLYH